MNGVGDGVNCELLRSSHCGVLFVVRRGTVTVTDDTVRGGVVCSGDECSAVNSSRNKCTGNNSYKDNCLMENYVATLYYVRIECIVKRNYYRGHFYRVIHLNGSQSFICLKGLLLSRCLGIRHASSCV